MMAGLEIIVPQKQRRGILHKDKSAMEQQYRQDLVRSNTQDQSSQQSHANDQALGGIEEMGPSNLGAGYGNSNGRPQTSQSADFPSSLNGFSPHPENDRFPSPNLTYQQQFQPLQQLQQPPTASRPSSGLSGAGHGGHTQLYQDPQRAQQSEAKAQSSVVIKVGMVGDAQIGKTSLMVKYVEGSWDEDYIQTLGEDAAGA